MKTMISNLPRDLIVDIISRVPLKSIKAVRLTCKSWNNLSKSESFAKIHIGKAATTREGETMIIALMNNLYLMNVVVDDVNPSIEFKDQLSFFYYQVGITQVFHHEGLLLCILLDANRIMVWNPYWGQTRWIKLRYISHRPDGYEMFNYSLGYEDKESCRSVKLLRFIDYFYEAPEKQFFWYEIYDFDSGLWKTLDVTPHWSIVCASRSFCSSASLKGNTYWCAKERNSNDFIKHYIICFDFTKERFGPLLPLPPSVRNKGYPYVTLSCIREEKLAALFQYCSYVELEIWITTKIEAEMLSWSKFLRMGTGPEIGIQMSSCIDEEKQVFMGFEREVTKTSINIIGEAEYLKEVNIIGEAEYLKKMNIIAEAEYVKEMDLGVPEGRQYCWSNVCSYVPSLVQIKKPARGKRKRQSSLEKRRFDINKLRFDEVEKLV